MSGNCNYSSLYVCYVTIQVCKFAISNVDTLLGYGSPNPRVLRNANERASLNLSYELWVTGK